VKVLWTEQAWRRLCEIEEFIARDRPAAAEKRIDKLVDRGEALANHPDRGRKLPEIPGSGLREFVVDHYRIVYRKTASTIEILTVFEGHRLLRREELPTDE
jgi:plasmid stabilization system protein ParE